MTAPGRAMGLAAAEFFGDVDLGVHLVANEEASRRVRQADAVVDAAVHDGRFGAHIPRDRLAAKRGNAFGVDVGPGDAEPFEQVIDAIQRTAGTSAGNDQVSVCGPKNPLLFVKLTAIDARLFGERGRADVDGAPGRLGLGNEHARHAGHFAQVGVEFLRGRLLGDGRRVGKDDGHGATLFEDEDVLPGGHGSEEGEGQHGGDDSIHSGAPWELWGAGAGDAGSSWGKSSECPLDQGLAVFRTDHVDQDLGAVTAGLHGARRRHVARVASGTRNGAQSRRLRPALRVTVRQVSLVTPGTGTG